MKQMSYIKMRQIDMLGELIKALKIFKKYGNPPNATLAGQGVFYVIIDPNIVSRKHLNKLEDFGFYPDFEDGSFYSFRYG